MKKIFQYGMIVAVAGMCACGGQKGWKVSGSIDNAPEGSKLSLEVFNGAGWLNIDSVEIGKDGSFRYTAETPSPYAEVYRLGLDGRNIYFPVDSVDQIVVKADANAFDTGYELSGSQAAADMMQVDKLLSEAVAASSAQEVLADSLVKRRLNEMILADENGVVSYYIINKTLGGKPLYDSSNRRDLAMIGALANKFSTARPNDPRTAFLAARYLYGRQANGSVPAQTIEATTMGYFDIELYDQWGHKSKLSDLATPGHVTLLSFTAYGLEPSVAYNVELNRLVQLFGDGLKIYQVSFDDNEVEWMQAAQNLPWVAVRNNPADGDMLLRTYNVNALPTTFVIGSDAELVERVLDPTGLEAAIRKAK